MLFSRGLRNEGRLDRGGWIKKIVSRLVSIRKVAGKGQRGSSV